MVAPVGPYIISEVRFIRNTTDADAQMVGNESTDVAGGKDFFDSCCLFTWCQATDHHHQPAIRPAMWRCSKILRVLQQHHSSSKPPRGRSKSKAEHPWHGRSRKGSAAITPR